MRDGLVRNHRDGRRLVAIKHISNGRIGDQNSIENYVRPGAGRAEVHSFSGVSSAGDNAGFRKEWFIPISGEEQLHGAIDACALGPFQPDMVSGVFG